MTDRSTAAVDVTVTPVNDPPVAHPETVQAIEDTPVTQIDVQLLANDTDIDDTHGSLTLQLVSQPQHGTLTATAGNHWTYTPDQDWNEDGDGVLDTFLYRVDDGNVLSNAVDRVDPRRRGQRPAVVHARRRRQRRRGQRPGQHSRAGRAAFDPGAPDEADQVIHFTIALGAGEASLFSTQPAVGAPGLGEPGTPDVHAGRRCQRDRARDGDAGRRRGVVRGRRHDLRGRDRSIADLHDHHLDGQRRPDR